MDLSQGKRWTSHGCRHARIEGELNVIRDERRARDPAAIPDAHVHDGGRASIDKNLRIPYESRDIGYDIATTARWSAAGRSIQIGKS